MKRLFILGLFLLTVAFSASAQDLPSIRITNNTGYDIYYIYISPSDAEGWGDDFLGDDILLAGHSINIRLGYPLSMVDTYDVCVEDEDGDTYRKDKLKLTDNARIVFSEEDLEF
jgi:hypothetical protein